MNHEDVRKALEEGRRLNHQAERGWPEGYDRISVREKSWATVSLLAAAVQSVPTAAQEWFAKNLVASLNEPWTPPPPPKKKGRVGRPGGLKRPRYVGKQYDYVAQAFINLPESPK